MTNMGDKTHVGKLVYFHLKEENKKRSASTLTKTCPSLFCFQFHFPTNPIYILSANTTKDSFFLPIC